MDFKWYAVHTFSGLENRAKSALQERIRQYNMEEKFGEIMLPTETVEEIKGGVRKAQNRKVLPGYMLIQMELTDETGHLVRNTPKITGFVGNTKKPSPLTQVEVERMQAMVHGIQKPRAKVEFLEGDQVKVIEGPFANFNGNVEEVKPDKQKLKVLVSIFGRATPVELDYVQVERVA